MVRSYPKPWTIDSVSVSGVLIVHDAESEVVCTFDPDEPHDLVVACVNAIGDRDPAAVVRLVEWCENIVRTAKGCSREFTGLVSALRKPSSEEVMT